MRVHKAGIDIVSKWKIRPTPSSTHTLRAAVNQIDLSTQCVKFWAGLFESWLKLTQG